MLHTVSRSGIADASTGPRQRGPASFFLVEKTRALAVAVTLLFCAVAVILGCAYKARTTIGSVRTAHLPLLEAALTLEDRVYGAVFHAGIFGATGDMASYSGLRVSFAGIRESAAKVAELAATVPGGREVARELEILDEFTRRLDLVAEKQRTLLEELAAERKEFAAVVDMEEILGRLVLLSRGIVALAGEDVAAAVSQADDTLLTALVFGGLFFAAAAAISLGALLARRG